MAELDVGGQPVIGFATVAECESWFERHHADHRGFWLKIGKAGGPRSVTYAEALQIALCFGWIDGQKRGLDDQHWLQRFTPRGSRGKWSQINRDKAESLIASGAMRPAGLREVERARADGRWAAAYESQGNATVPADLAEALAADPEAAAFFATLSSVNRYAILYRVHDAKRPETRARRIETFVAMCREHKTLH